MFALAATPDVRVLRWDDDAAARRRSALLSTFSRPPPPGDSGAGPDKDTDLGNGSYGKRHTGAEGRMGSSTAKHEHRRYGLKGRRNEPDLHLARYRAAEAGGAAGVLPVLRGSHVASIFGRDTALGRDADDALGGLIGLRPGEGRGAGGLALVGTGPAGRGQGEGTIGLTSCGTIGGGGG
jgi:hypothetical protein